MRGKEIVSKDKRKIGKYMTFNNAAKPECLHEGRL
jgi:hypothetical protein